MRWNAETRVWVAVGLTLLLAVWEVRVIPHGGGGEPLGLGVLLVWPLIGVLCGRWLALLLPYVVVLAIGITGAEGVGADQPAWIPALIAATILNVPLTAGGVLVSKMLEARKKDREGAS
jgi:hypothetical protein